MKTCLKCGAEKEPEEFHVDRARKDGRHPYCAACQSKKAAKWCRENRERALRNERAYKARNRDLHNERSRQYVAENPEKVLARKLANDALRRGEILKPESCACGNVGHLQMHHPDYAKPLAVVWLCASCHMRLHHSTEAA